MEVKVELEGMKEMQKLLRKVSPRIATNILRAVTAGMARDIRNDAQNILDSKVTHRTFNLRNSLQVKRDKVKPSLNEISASVVAKRSGNYKGYHWHLIEFGTVKGPALEHITPATESMASRASSVVEKKFFKVYLRTMKREAKKLGLKP